jgi:2-dehydro-3-deoxygluconokinase
MDDAVGSHGHLVAGSAGARGVVCFGEILLRLNPPGHQRIVQAEAFEASFAGGEANVAVSLAQFGLDARYVTYVPPNAVGQAAVNALRRYGVNTSAVHRGGERLGLYFVEKGASQRPSTVLYDRAGSAVAQAKPADYDWDQILAGAGWLHLTGITPALSENAATACLDAAKAAAALGLTVSCDLNYRSRLWTREQARAVMSRLMQYVDVCIANEEDAADVFGIQAPGSDVASGTLNLDGYTQVAQELTRRFGVGQVAITLRGSISASENTWSGLLYDGERIHTAPEYRMTIVDRVGGGDSFAAGLIYALTTGLPAGEAIRFAVAASCLKHSIEHDFNLVSVAEVAALAAGSASGRVQR